MIPIKEWVAAFRILHGLNLTAAVGNKEQMAIALSSNRFVPTGEFDQLCKLLLTGAKDQNGKILSMQSFESQDPNGRFAFFDRLAEIIHENFSTLQCLQQRQPAKTQS
jgi:hypothetical protein